MPGAANSLKILFVQLLEGFRLAMAVETLADLQSEKFEGAGGSAGSRTVCADDEDGRLH